MPDRPVHMLAPQHQLDGPADHPCGQDAEDLRSGNQALSSRSRRRETDCEYESSPAGCRTTRRCVLAPSPCPGSAYRSTGYRRPMPPRSHAAPSRCDTGSESRRSPRSAACRRKAGLDIATAHFGGIADADRGRHKAVACIEADPGRLDLISRRQQCRALGRGFQRLGDHHRDRLVGVTHLVVLQQLHPEHEGVQLGVGILRQRRPVGRRHHLDHAGMGLGGRDVEEADAAARDAADGEHRVQHAGRMVVGGVTGWPVTFSRPRAGSAADRCWSHDAHARGFE